MPTGAGSVGRLWRAICGGLGWIATSAPLNAAFIVGFLLAFVLPLGRPIRTGPD